MQHKQLEGIISAIVTPMNANGSINWNGLKELIPFLLKNGVHGIFPCGSTGEGILLTTEERKKVAEFVVKEVNRRIPVVLHTGSIHIDEAIELTVHARDIGAKAAALIPPYYYGMDNAAIMDYFATVAQAIPDFPLYVYNIPMNVKNTITPGVMAELNRKYPSIIGVKESSMDFMNFINFQQALPQGFCILMGNDAQIYSAIQMGGNGAISASSTAFPEPVVAIWESLKRGDTEKALKAQDTVIKLREILRNYPPVASYKWALELRGIQGGVPRKPLRKLTQEEEKKLQTELELLGVL